MTIPKRRRAQILPREMVSVRKTANNFAQRKFAPLQYTLTTINVFVGALAKECVNAVATLRDILPSTEER